MTLAVVAFAVQRGLALLGEPARLDGRSCGKVNIERNARLDAGDPDRANDNNVARADVATILSEYDPRVGQTLEHPDGMFQLARLLDDSGYSRRFIVA